MYESKATVVSNNHNHTPEPLALVPTPYPNFINQIVNGDCLTVLPQLAARSVDFVLTDPPYLAHYRDRSDRKVINDDRAGWLTPAFAEIYRVLKPDRFCVSFYGWSQVDKFFAAWRAAGFRAVGHLVWPKRYASAWRFLGYCHEQAYLLVKGNPPLPSHHPRRARMALHR
jgi:adenine-specific DNA-methyltransferase